MQDGKKGWIDYYVYPDQSLIIEKFNGKIDLNLLKRASLAIWTDPNYDKTTRGMVDLRGSYFDLSLGDIARLVSFFFANNQTTRAFIVMLADDSHAIAKSYILGSKVSTMMNIHIVSSMDSALRHLTIKEEKLAVIDTDKAHRVY